MQLSQKQLDAHLKKSLSPLYFISGDEPLLIQEARDMVLRAALDNGFSEKTTLHLDGTVSIESLIQAVQNQSLFSEKKIIDIRNQNAKFDPQQTEFLERYAKQPPSDCIVVISAGKLTPAQQKSSLITTVKNNGVYLPIWPIQLNELPSWIVSRGKNASLTIPMDIANLLANFTESNLLATQQVIEKLQLLYPNTVISRDQLISVLSDFARFDIFDLIETIAKKNIKKTARVMARLQQSGEEPPLVLWAICRKIRENNAFKIEVVKKSLLFAANIDEMIKGARSGDVWQALLQLSLFLCGQPLLMDESDA